MITFYGPGFKSLENAVRAYRQYAKMYQDPHCVLVMLINPTNDKWYVQYVQVLPC